ncbi:MAG: RNA polymerase sigma factor RpoD, partial [Rubrivivax sp.]|nr:RNA polymerase sigma factor RpoD [Rubrivivax sp.]
MTTPKKPAAQPAKPAAKSKDAKDHQAKYHAKDGKAKPAAQPAKPAAKPAPAAKTPAKPAEKAPAKAQKPEAKAPAKPGKAAAAKPEAKGKGAKKGPEAKAAGDDVDLADIEADIEGEAEVEPEAVVEVAEAEKAKPLRMKVSRAKERALMREFGLEETTLTEEEASKRRQELKTLIKMGKTRGFLTHQEINDHLPERLINEEILEAIVSMLNDMGIAVYEQAPDAATLLVAGGTTATATDEEAEEAAEAALSTVDSEFGRTTDPVRMYMREMGTVE